MTWVYLRSFTNAAIRPPAGRSYSCQKLRYHRPRVRFGLLSLILITLLCEACKPLDAFSCHSLRDAALIDFPVSTNDPAIVREWIHANYPEAGTLLKESDDAPQKRHQFYWSLDGKMYDIVVSDKTGAVFNLTWKRDSPGLKEIRRCLGEPASYDAFVGPAMYGVATFFGVWYPQKRLLLISSTEWGAMRAITEDIAFSSFAVVKPELVQALDLKPWPADFSGILIRTLPSPATQ